MNDDQILRAALAGGIVAFLAPFARKHWTPIRNAIFWEPLYRVAFVIGAIIGILGSYIIPGQDAERR